MNAASSSGASKGVWVLLAGLYSTQRLGLSFIFVALVAISRQQGIPLERLGIIYALGLFWVLKCLWAPLVDWLKFGRFGHYRGWLALTQGGMTVTLLCLGRFEIPGQFIVVLSLCVLLAFLSSTQEIATEALACRLLRPEERGLGNALQVAGSLVGNLIGGGMVLMVYPYIGWNGSMIILAGCTALSLIQVVFLRESALPLSRVQAASLPETLGRLRAFWKRPGMTRWMALVTIYPIGMGLAFALVTPLLVDKGWLLERIGLVMNVFGPPLGIMSALMTGWLLRRFGRRITLTSGALLQALGVFALCNLTRDGAGQMGIFLVLGLLHACYTPGITALCTVMMDKAVGTSPGTNYSLQYGLFALVSFVSGGLSTVLASAIGYENVVVLATCAALAAAVLTPMLYPGSAPTPVNTTLSELEMPNQ